MRHTCLDLAEFLVNAPSLFDEEATQDEEVEPDIAQGTHKGGIRRFCFSNGDTLSCVRWDSQFHITSTDIIRALVHRFEDIKRPVINIKKFEEGVFSDLRCLKPGVDARLELPRSEFLELLYKHHCVRTQKKQKVFYWTSVPHDTLFRDALERDLKREAMGIEPTTKITDDADPSSFVVIGGMELPLSVPPTLAAHTCSGSSSGSSAVSRSRVSTATVTASSAARHGTNTPKDKGTATAHTTTKDHSASLGSTSHAQPSSSCAERQSSQSMQAENTQSADDLTEAANTASKAVHANDIYVHSSHASQPTLSEYITSKSTISANSSTESHGTMESSLARSANGSAFASGFVPMNNSWTGMDFQTLQRYAMDLKADYNEYQPTPTPHHSPKESAELAGLINTDPNALITQSNVHSFSELLEQLIGSSGRIEESNSTAAPDSQLLSLNVTQPIFSSSQLSASSNQQSTGMPVHPSSQSAMPTSMDLEMGNIAIMDSIHPSPSIVSMASSHHMSTTQTPEASASSHFTDRHQEHSRLMNELDSLLTSVNASNSAPASANGTNGMPMNSLSANMVQPLSNMAPLFGVAPDYPGLNMVNNALSNSISGMQPVTSEASSPKSRAAAAATAAVDAKSMDIVRQLWLSQKPSVAPTPRSTRFSRYHPYLKSMARMAHRGSSSLLNRVPSTADPNVAAAAVNAMVATVGRGTSNTLVSTSGSAAISSSSSAVISTAPPMPLQHIVMPSTPQDRETPASGASAKQVQPMSDVEHDGAASEKTLTLVKRKSKSKACDEDDQPRRYPCTFAGCTKQFKRQEHLKRHFRIHTGERPYKCPAPDCGKDFARMDNLNQHIRTHVNRKTASRRAGRKPIDGSTSQQQSLNEASTNDRLSLDYSVDGLAKFEEESMPNPVSSNESMQPSLGFASNGTGAEFLNSIKIPAPVSMPPQTSASEMRMAVPDGLTPMNQDWLMGNMKEPVRQAEQQQQQQQQQLLQSPPLAENNAVAMLRRISRSNRARIVGGSSVGVGDFGARPKDEPAFTPYGPSGIPEMQNSGSAAGGDSSSSSLLRTLSTESNPISSVWLATFLAQQQQQQQQFLATTAASTASLGAMHHMDESSSADSNRPVSLKRHHEDDDDYGDISMGSASSDGSQHSISASSSDRQGKPVTGGVNANKFVRSGLARKSHIMPV
ncbi:hypothetical protein EV183_003610 [Coemansia sp. RSA 2336]|nr:hypothetical protein EV183_003610 [Coemansia sp. RSA 2336]